MRILICIALTLSVENVSESSNHKHTIRARGGVIAQKAISISSTIIINNRKTRRILFSYMENRLVSALVFESANKLPSKRTKNAQTTNCCLFALSLRCFGLVRHSAQSRSLLNVFLLFLCAIYIQHMFVTRSSVSRKTRHKCDVDAPKHLI